MLTAVIAALVTVAASNSPHAAVLSYTGGFQAGTRGANATVGWSFKTNESVTVTALDSQSLGAGSHGMVRLYDAAGDILASAMLSFTDPTETVGSAVYHRVSIAPITLLANTKYFITNDIGAGTQFRGFVASVTTDPAITYLGPVSSEGQGGTPTGNTRNFETGDFGPNFDIRSVPEPAGIGALLVGLAGLGFTRPRRA